MVSTSALLLLLVATAAPAQLAGDSAAHVHTRGVRILQPQADTPTPPEGASPTASANPPAAVTATGGPAAPATTATSATTPTAAPAAKPATTPAPVAVASVIKACPRPFSAPDLRVDAGADLRGTLGPKLRAGHRVVLDLAAPYAPGGPAPGGLAPWFDEIRLSGGTVTVAQYCERTRSAFGNWLARLFGGGGDPGKPYAAARKFDAVLHADALDRVVTQVEFVPRGGGRS